MNRWIPDRRPAFIKQFGRLDSTIRRKAENAILEILTSENPARLGRYKRGKRVFSYDLGRKCRIIYNVNWADNTIEFLRICDHKSSYGTG